jgi:hypothetical protein
MSTYTETSQKIQGQVLAGIKQLQAANLEMAATFSKATGSVLPGAAKVPAGYDPREYIEQSFGFTTDILELQRDFLVRITETLKPAASANGSTRAAKPA